MKKNLALSFLSIALVFVFVLSAAGLQTVAAEGDTPVLGILLVGPYNDHGWSQATYEGVLYAAEKTGGEAIYIDSVNVADRPGTTAVQLAESLMDQGANIIVFNSDDMKADALEFAELYPEVPVLHLSGDAAWQDGMNYAGLDNITNIMPWMEYGKMMAGCAAAMTTETGKIGFLGPLINDETRRYANALYLGAQHCWTEYRGMDAADLELKVTWIGFWFNIPGFTADPTQVADDFYNSGFDVVVSGIDTTEALVQAKAHTENGNTVHALGYDYANACEEAADVCLGVPYFNWGPSITTVVEQWQAGEYTSAFITPMPVFEDLNNVDVSPIGFTKGAALSEDAAAAVDSFIAELGDGLNLFTGPLNWQDGSVYLADGEEATEAQIWYSGQLLEGMQGQSVVDAE